MTHPHDYEAFEAPSATLRDAVAEARTAYASQTERLCPVCAAQELISRLFDEAIMAAVAIGQPDPINIVKMLVAAWNYRGGANEIHH